MGMRESAEAAVRGLASAARTPWALVEWGERHPNLGMAIGANTLFGIQTITAIRDGQESLPEWTWPARAIFTMAALTLAMAAKKLETHEIGRHTDRETRLETTLGPRLAKAARWALGSVSGRTSVSLAVMSATCAIAYCIMGMAQAWLAGGRWGAYAAPVREAIGLLGDRQWAKPQTAMLTLDCLAIGNLAGSALREVASRRIHRLSSEYPSRHERMSTLRRFGDRGGNTE